MKSKRFNNNAQANDRKGEIRIYFPKRILLVLAIALAGMIPILVYADGYYDERVKDAEDHEIFPVKGELEALLRRYRDAIRAVEALDIIDLAAERNIGPETQASMDTLRNFLEADSLFVMDVHGTQLAGSGAVSVGRNYRYRPYFQKAIAGNTYVYPGIGRNLQTLRMFFSAPHLSHQNNSPIGIVGLSVSVNKMADALKPANPNSILGLITEDGIVFATSSPALLYKMVLPIEQNRVKEIQDSQQFGNVVIEPAGFSLDKNRVLVGQTNYSVQRAKLQNTNIEFFSLHPVDEKEYLVFLCGVGFVYLLIVYLGFRLSMSLSQIKSQQETLRTANALLLESQHALIHQATHDPLTDLLNRRAGLEHLTKELARSKRHGDGLAIGMCDIDHFKKINDTWGHQTGDEVLCQISQVLVKGVREYDVVVRWGGEEFLLIVPVKAGVDIDALFERLCKEVADKKIKTGTAELEITISIGVAYALGDANMTNLLAEADAALYQAKALGRNRVVHAPKT